MKGKQIQKINLCVSEKKRERPFSDCVGDFHLRFVERRLHQMPLSTADKLIVIDNIIKTMREQEQHQVFT